MATGDIATGTGDAPQQDAGRHGLPILVAAVLVAIGAIFALVVRVGDSLDLRDRALDRERHGYQIVLATRSVATSLASAEAALGRFAISADRATGATYYDDWVMAGAQITRLRDLVASDPEALALAGRLATLYTERGRELGLPAIHAARHDGWAALNLFNDAGRSPRIAAIEATLEAIRQHEVEVLARRTQKSDAATIDSVKLMHLLSLIGLLLIVATGGLALAVSIAAQRHRAARDDADDAADRASWLGAAINERTRELTAVNARLEKEIAERATAEARVRQMQKMDAIGQLTGGIAHDFNNMLAVVIGGLDLARRRTDASSNAAVHIERAMEGAARAAALTRRLLGFARAEPLLPERIEPARLIEGMSDLMDRTIGERVRIEIRTDADGWPVFVDPVQLENAILNLTVNGRDAMAGTGKLVIETANVMVADGGIGNLIAGDYVRIAVTDDGAGMDAAMVERAFEPFFTTKPPGRGTGLGLSQVFGFARQSGGDVHIASTPGKGTTVAIYLPRASAAAASAQLSGGGAEIVRLPVARATPRLVLVVEDDARVRAATCEALAELGHTTLFCADGVEALAVLARRPDIAIMLSDVVMPGMTGPELAAKARFHRPELPVLFVTGFAGEDGAELRGERVLRKPYTVAALERAVAATLAAVSEPPPLREAAAGE